MRRLAGLICALLALAPAAAAPSRGGGDPGLRLEKIVLVQRHGVRSPTKSPEALSRFSAEPWPAWPVAPGILTPHGERDVRLMGAWLRADYARRGVWPAKGCLGQGATYVWADGKDQRTRASGQALLDGAFPGCGLEDESGPEGQPDGMFSSTAKGLCPIDPEEARKAVVARAHGDLDAPDPRYAAAKAALAKVLAPDAAPCKDDKGVCFLNGRNELKAGGEDGVKLGGPLADAATIAESLFLEYVEGMPPETMGWGRAGSEAAVAAVMPLHDISVELMRQTPYLAAHNGSLMMRAVLQALAGRPSLPRQGGAGTSMTAIAGHDTNISSLAGILGVDWALKGQPDKTPPDGALVFELWRDKGGERFVRTAFVYQTADQLRRETPLEERRPAGRVELAVPGCADGPDGACRLQTFERLIASRLPSECVLAAGPERP